MTGVGPCTNADFDRDRPGPVPLGAWRGAVALATKRHANARFPQPSDIQDALVVFWAIESLRGEVWQPPPPG
jgi:hypothetical protein